MLDTFLLSLSIDLEIRLIYISIRSNVFAVSLDEDEPDLFLAELVLAELVLDPPVYLLFTLTEDVKEAVIVEKTKGK